MAKQSSFSTPRRLKSRKIFNYIDKHYEKLLGLIVGLAFVGPYGFGDDYAFAENSRLIPESILKSAVGQGRPLLGLFAIGQFRFVDDFSDFIFIHLIQMVVFIAALTLLRHVVHSILGNKKRNIEIGIIISFISTAGTLTLLGWSVQLGPLLSLVVCLGGIYKILTSKKRRIRYFLCLGLPILTYQPVFILILTMFFLTLIYAESIALREIKSKFVNLPSLITFAFFFGIEIGCLLMGKKLGWTQGERGSLVSNIPGKINWIIEGAIPQGLKFSGPWVQSNTTLWIVFLLVLTGMIFTVGRRFKIIPLPFILCLLALAPSILISENWSSNRSMMSLQFLFSFFSIYGFTCLLKYITFDSKKYLFFAQVLVVLILSINAVFLAKIGWKDPQLLEIAIAKNAISSIECETVKSVRPSGWQLSVGRFVSMDEYGIPSSTPPWSVKPFTVFICNDLGVRLPVEVDVLDREDVPNKDHVKNVIDFQQILNGYAISQKSQTD